MANAKGSKPLNNQAMQLALIENFVSLQKVMTNMGVKFDNLSENISKLLQLFELSAKGFIRKQEEGFVTSEDKEVLKKLDTLLEQNKTVAKGLTLIEEKIRHKIYPESTTTDEHFEQITGRPRPKPLPMS